MSGLRSRWREQVSRHLPVALMEYPFEAFAAVYGTLSAGVVLAGGGLTDGIRSAVPAIVIALWAAALALASLTLGLGLFKAFRLAIPVGLRLLALTLGSLAVAAVALDPSTALGAALVGFIAVLAAGRSFYLRALTLGRHRARMMRRR